MQSIFDRFWPSFAIGKKKNSLNLTNLNYYFCNKCPKNFILDEFEENRFFGYFLV